MIILKQQNMITNLSDFKKVIFKGQEPRTIALQFSNSFYFSISYKALFGLYTLDCKLFV